MRTAMVAGALGKGLVAGAIGTAVMTVSSSIEAKLTKREPSTAPADAASKVLGYTPSTVEAKAKFSAIVHWTYGTALGAVRGVIGGAGFRGPFGTAAHFGGVWGSELVLLPKLDVAPPVNEWTRKDLAIDFFHHAVYAVSTGLVYRALDLRRARHH